VAQAVRELAPEDEAAETPPLTPAANVGIVFALALEAGCFVDKLQGVVTTRGARFHVDEGGLGGQRVVAIVSGPGQGAARHATEALLAGHRPQRVISAGLAGGLSPKLRRGDVLFADIVRDMHSAQHVIDFTLQPPSSLGRWHCGTLLTADSIIHAPADKRTLCQEHGALAVDMETFAVADVCKRHSIPFLSARVISDAVDDSLPADIDHLMRQSSWAGRAGAVLGTVFRRPESAKELWQLKENALVAGDRLARFLEWMVQIQCLSQNGHGGVR
jgi:adenosylhomocysteine nucleosidase